MRDSSQVATAAAGAFVLAAAASAALILLAIVTPDAIGALKAIGGKPGSGTIDPALLPPAVCIDFVLPSAYGAGLALFAAALGGGGASGLAARAAIAAALVGAGADFSENALIVAQAGAQAGAGGYQALIGLLTFVKYGILSVGVLLIGSLLPGKSTLYALTSFILQFVTPVVLALLVSGLGGSAIELGFPFIMVGTFLLLAWVARDFSRSVRDASGES